MLWSNKRQKLKDSTPDGLLAGLVFFFLLFFVPRPFPSLVLSKPIQFYIPAVKITHRHSTEINASEIASFFFVSRHGKN